MGVLLTILIGLISLEWSDATAPAVELPCEFHDSINITNGDVKQSDTLIFDRIKFPKGQYAEVNYTLVNGSERLAARPHFRGCPCNVKACIRLCCPLGSFVDNTKLISGQRIPCIDHPAARDYQREVFDRNNQSQVVKLDDHFAYTIHTRRKNFYTQQDFQIMNTGHIQYENDSWSHGDYCLRSVLNETSNEIQLDVLVFYEHEDGIEKKNILTATGNLISVPFIAATLLVYICLPELRNLHGKCLICYLIGLIIGYTLSACVKLNGWHYVDPIYCKPTGHIIYFSLLSAFLWSNVISYDLWRNFRNTHIFRKYSDQKRFIVYMVYAWGLSSLLTFIIFVLDMTKPFASYLLPGVGLKTCFIKTERLAQFIYFYLPTCIIFSMNIVFFFLTAFKIHRVQRELARITSQEESSRHQNNLNNEKDNLILYVRLFIIMGVTWIMEGISFAISPKNDSGFLIMDLWNTLQGVVIFALFVMKRRVLGLIKKRYNELFGRNDHLPIHSSTKSSNVRPNQIFSSQEKLKYKEFNSTE